MAQVTIYSTPTCSYCSAAKEYFKANNIEFTEKDVSTDQSAQQEMITKSGQMGVPVIEIDSEIVVGFDQARLKELLKL